MPGELAPDGNGAEHVLLGTWRKTSADECGRLYPARLEIGPSRYRGQQAPGQPVFTVWDVGSVSVAGEAVTFSTATDALVTYPFELAGDELAFTDDQGCRITYQRTR